MKISVVIPTRERWELLAACLDSVLGQSRPPDEVVVVDNASRDGGGDALRAQGLARLRVVREERPGVDHARNRGVAESAGDIVAFIDDDALAGRGWLEALAEAFADPGVMGAGGPVRLLFPEGAGSPLLRSQRVLHCLGLVDYGPETHRIDPRTQSLCGTNLAFRRDLLLREPGFRGALPFPGMGVCGDDYELSRRLAADNAVRYEPKAVVEHRIPAHKLSAAYLLKRIVVFHAAGVLMGNRFRPQRSPRQLAGVEGLVSAASALGHLLGWLLGLRRKLPAAALLLGLAALPLRAAQPDIILISLDTVRPDHAGCYGYRRPTTPNLDRFARDAVLFEDAVSAAPWTLPSHMSMFTSLYPHEHGMLQHPKAFSLRKNLRIVREVWQREGWPGLVARFLKEPRIQPRSLNRKAVTLPEILRQAGYRTAGFAAAETLDGRYGFAKGCDVYDNLPFRAGPEQNALALDWLKKAGGRPSFLFLHYYDAHGNFGRNIEDGKKMGAYPVYDAPPPHGGMFDDGQRGRFDGTIRSLLRLRRSGSHTATDLRTLIAQYDGGIHYADHSLGEFLRSLKELGRYDGALILVTSDHGEELLERGEVIHNDGLSNTLLHVLSVLKLPGAEAKGLRVRPLVRTVDYLPTLLAAAGLPTGPALQAQMRGVSLLSPIRAGRFPALTAYSEVDIQGSPAPLKALRDPEGWKLLYNPSDHSARLYFLPKDPFERADLSEREPNRTGIMLEELLKLSGTLEH
ncbi:MAG: hypothetical protein A2X36_04035 [Elusimicrobia bacterium GWA2_69_24]|nr:MAG: hypothetical protein A2X36_04035 [Elusimicrobia bacterium GWA2_69_24]